MHYSMAIKIPLGLLANLPLSSTVCDAAIILCWIPIEQHFSFSVTSYFAGVISDGVLEEEHRCTEAPKKEHLPSTVNPVRNCNPVPNEIESNKH